MAVKLIANYAKRLGLPGFSSHQFSLSVEVELHDVADIAGESARLYQTLQQNVDQQIQATGFVPPEGYGMESKPELKNAPEAREAAPQGTNGAGEWHCSEKQKELIESIVREKNLDKREVEAMAIELFGQGVKSLNRLSASGLIDQLLQKYGGGKAGTNGRGRRFAREGAR